MMELWCASVLVLCSVVIASPHGYGVKSGASARAEASSVAAPFGSFGAVPLSIPNGGGYSGSYSKSSSSSFASSSASSSSSSFSFSGSGNIPGAGANGLSGANGIAVPGSGGCAGGCQTGKNGLAGSLGGDNTANGQTYSGAKAAATAGSAVFGVSPTNLAPCTSGDCSKQTPNICKGSNCDGSINDSEKCTSGKCEPNIEGSSTTFGSNDIFVNNNNNKNSNTVKPEVAGTGPECLNGNCGPTDTSSKPYTSVSSGTYPVATESAQNKPATVLSTPKQDVPCTTANCGSLAGSLYDKPSSYNVPIHGSYSGASLQDKKPCTSGNCGNDQSNSPQLSGPSGPSSIYPQDVTGPAQVPSNTDENIPAFVPLGSPRPSNCGTPNCVGNSLNPNGNPTSPASQYPTNSGQPGFSAPSAVSAAGANALPGSYVTPKPSATAGTATQTLPNYTGGFKGPAGFLKPPTTSYKHTAPATSYNPVVSQSSTSQIHQDISTSGQHNQPTAPAAAYNPIPCSTGNCGTQLGQQSPQYGQAGFSTGQQYKPTVPTGSYGSSSCSSGNCGSTSGIPSSQYKPTAPAGPYNPSNCPSGNCVPQSGQSSPVYGQSSSSRGAILKPISPAGSSFSTGPCASGNCGLPGQSLPQQSQSGSPSGITYKPPTPPGSFPSTCTSGNCGGTNLPSPPSGSQYKPSVPASTFGSSGCSFGNCGTQGGQTLSHQYQNGLQTNIQNKPPGPSGAYNPTACTTANCGLQYGQLSPQTPQTGASAGAPYQPTGSVVFGGPAGILKPNEYNIPSSVPSSNYKPTVPAGSINPPSCSTTGTCGSQSGQPPPSQYIPSGPQYKPSAPQGSLGGSVVNGPTGSYKPTACPSGNCGASDHSSPQYGQSGVTASQATAGAAANANTVVYTGGFGGPPGLLKPYDDGKLGSASPAAGKYPSASQTGSGYHGSTTGSGLQSSYGKSLNGVGAGALPGAGAQASAVAGATAGAYSGNYNNEAGNYGNNSGGCKGGCRSNGDGNLGGNFGGFSGLPAAGASAKSVANTVSSAGPGSFGGSFASSSASAHASSGAVTKGSYGRR